MKISWLQSAMLGFVSGLSEPLPLSAEAHRAVLSRFFGIDGFSPLLLFLCHLASLVVVLLVGRLELKRLRRTAKLLKTPARRRMVQPELNSTGTLKLLRTALPIAVIGRLLGFYLTVIGQKLYLLTLTLILSGIILHIPTHMRTANKDGRHLGKVDGVLMGLGFGLCAIPGVSGVGAAVSVGLIQGADRRYAVRFAWMLLCAGLCASMGIDVLRIIGTGMEFDLSLLLSAAVTALSAALGTMLAVRLMFALIRRGGAGISGFSYYNWGLALLCMALFLLV
jgi:undecaprenyl-diphosphatase